MVALLSDHGAPKKELAECVQHVTCLSDSKASEDLTAGLGPGKELKSASYIYQQ